MLYVDMSLQVFSVTEDLRAKLTWSLCLLSDFSGLWQRVNKYRWKSTEIFIMMRRHLFLDWNRKDTQPSTFRSCWWTGVARKTRQTWQQTWYLSNLLYIHTQSSLTRVTSVKSLSLTHWLTFITSWASCDVYRFILFSTLSTMGRIARSMSSEGDLFIWFREANWPRQAAASSTSLLEVEGTWAVP